MTVASPNLQPSSQPSWQRDFTSLLRLPIVHGVTMVAVDATARHLLEERTEGFYCNFGGSVEEQDGPGLPITDDFRQRLVEEIGACATHIKLAPAVAGPFVVTGLAALERELKEELNFWQHLPQGKLFDFTGATPWLLLRHNPRTGSRWIELLSIFVCLSRVDPATPFAVAESRGATFRPWDVILALDRQRQMSPYAMRVLRHVRQNRLGVPNVHVSTLFGA